MVKLVTHTYLSLLQHPSHITGEAALRLVLSDLRAQLSRVTKEGMMVATLILIILCGMQPSPANDFNPFLQHSCIRRKVLSSDTVLLLPGAFKEGVTMARYSLSLLSQVAVQNLHAAAIWAGLHDICKPSGTSSIGLMIQHHAIFWFLLF